MLRSVWRIPSWRSRAIRLRSASMARARKCLKRKMFSRAGPTCAAMLSSQAKSCFWNDLRPLVTKIRPVGWPSCSKATVMKDPTFSSCCAGPGSRGRFLIFRPSRRSKPKPEPGPESEFQQIVASMSSRRKPSVRASGKCARCEAEPGKHANPVNFAFHRRQQNQCQRECPSKRQCQVQAPANSGRVTDEHIGKPNRDCRRADVHEETQRQKIAGQRKVPGAIAEEAFNLSKEKRNDKVGGQKRSGAARGRGRRLLENR